MKPLRIFHILRNPPPLTKTLLRQPTRQPLPLRSFHTHTHIPLRAHPHPSRLPRTTKPLRPHRFYTTTPPNAPKPTTANTTHTPTPTPTPSLSQRLRLLTRQYGWSAIGIYLALSALDFPIFYAAVRYLGTERLGRYEHVVMEYVGGVVPGGLKEAWREVKGMVMGWIRGKGAEGEGQGLAEDGEGNGGRGEGEGVASIWTQLAVAYALHKSFLFIRIPIAVAITPRVVKVLRGWGWDIGKKSAKTVGGGAKTSGGKGSS